MRIPVNFDPRWYQTEALQALERGVKRSIWCWSRRGGKDKTAFSYGVKKMIEQPMNVVLVFPTKKQGYDAFWTNIENDGFKTLDAIPKAFIVAQSNSPDNMKITLINGSTFTLLGATDPEALRGANGKLYIFSEFVDLDSAALGAIEPVVAVNGGQIIIQSTPKIDGISGATFKNLFDRAAKQPNQFASRITAKEYLTDEELEEIRQDIIARTGSDFFFRQEFLCDWGQASQKSYYGQQLKKLEAERRFGLFPYNRDYPVYTSWDLGRTAIVFWQYYMIDGRRQVRIIDYYATNVIGNEAVVRYVVAKPYNYGWHFFPHDGNVLEQNSATTRLAKFQELGLVNSSLLRREPVEDGINRMVELLPNIVFNEPTTSELVAKLYLYQRKYNGLTGDYEGPENKSAAHGADAFRYVGTAIEQEFIEETCDLYGSQVSDEEYESDMAQTTFYSPSRG